MISPGLADIRQVFFRQLGPVRPDLLQYFGAVHHDELGGVGRGYAHAAEADLARRHVLLAETHLGTIEGAAAG